MLSYIIDSRVDSSANNARCKIYFVHARDSYHQTKYDDGHVYATVLGNVAFGSIYDNDPCVSPHEHVANNYFSNYSKIVDLCMVLTCECFDCNGCPFGISIDSLGFTNIYFTKFSSADDTTKLY